MKCSMVRYSRYFHDEFSRFQEWIHIGQQTMVELLVSTIILKVFVDTEPRISFSLEGQFVPLA